MKSIPLLAVFIALFILPNVSQISFAADTKSEEKIQEELEKKSEAFVQEFYDWYLKEYNKVNKLSTLELATIKRKSSFAPKLYQALQEDFKAQRAADELVGLNFDPFVNGQDVVAERFVPGYSYKNGDSFWVEVYEIVEGRKQSRPALLVELALNKNKFLFKNLHFGISLSPGNLLDMLETLKKNRLKTNNVEPAKN